MARGRKPRLWIKLDCLGILDGSINYLLPLDGQAVWMKMLCLSEVSGGRAGYIEDNNNNALPKEYISHKLQCPLALLDEVLEKMQHDGAIQIGNTGSIKIVNYDYYQLTEYDRQKPYRKRINRNGGDPDANT